MSVAEAAQVGPAHEFLRGAATRHCHRLDRNAGAIPLSVERECDHILSATEGEEDACVDRGRTSGKGAAEPRTVPEQIHEKVVTIRWRCDRVARVDLRHHASGRKATPCASCKPGQDQGGILPPDPGVRRPPVVHPGRKITPQAPKDPGVRSNEVLFGKEVPYCPLVVYAVPPVRWEEPVPVSPRAAGHLNWYQPPTPNCSLVCGE